MKFILSLGDTRLRPGGNIPTNPSNSLMSQQFSPTPSSPPEYQSYPGLYFPPTESSLFPSCVHCSLLTWLLCPV